MLFQSFQHFLLNSHEIIKCIQGKSYKHTECDFESGCHNHPEATSNLLGSAQKVGIAQMSAITCDLYMKTSWILCTCVPKPTHSPACWWYQHGAHTCIHTYTHTHPCTHTWSHIHTHSCRCHPFLWKYLSHGTDCTSLRNHWPLGLVRALSVEVAFRRHAQPTS